MFINAVTGRGPAVIRTLLENSLRAFVAAPTVAGLAWVHGRLDPDHPGTQRMLWVIVNTVSRIDLAKVLVPDVFSQFLPELAVLFCDPG